jgi:hypothetical protein
MPAILAFSFGGYGDIIATIDLVHKFVNILNNVTSPETKALLKNLTGLVTLLYSVHDTMAFIKEGSKSTPGPNLLIENVVAGVLGIVSDCRVTIDECLRKVQDQSHQSRGIISVCWNGVWEVIVGQREVDSLRRELKRYYSQLQTALSLLATLTTTNGTLAYECSS